MLQAFVWAFSLEGAFLHLAPTNLTSFGNIFFIAGITASASVSLAAMPLLFLCFSVVLLSIPLIPVFTSGQFGNITGFVMVLVLYLIYLLRQTWEHRQMLFERVISSAELRTQNEHIQHIIDSVPAKISIFDLFGHHLFSNSEAKHLFDGKGTILNAGLFSLISRFSKGSESLVQRDLEIETVGSDSEVKEWHIVTLSKLGRGETMMVCLNVHQQFLAEQRLEDDRKRHEQAAKFSLIGEMVGGIAHEINNPLSILMGYSNRVVKIAGDQETPIDRSQLSEVGAKLLFTVDRIAKIVKSLKTISRNDEGGVEEWTALSLIIEEMKSLSVRRLESENVELRIDEIPSVAIKCLPMQLVLALMNLVSNAKDALRECDEKWVHVSFEEGLDGTFSIVVRDSGKGIPAEFASKIMDPFFTTKSPGEGTGMGLSLASTYIRTVEGSLELRSAYPTEFVIKLPVNRLRSTSVDDKQSSN